MGWEKRTNVVMMSWKSQTPMMVWITPLIADEIIWVTGEVTLIDRNPAIQMRKPNNPCETNASRGELALSSSSLASTKHELTVIAPPQMNLPRATPDSSLHMAAMLGPSPTITLNGSITIAESRLEYQARSMADPSTMGRLFLMMMAWQAVVREERIPKKIPRLRGESEEGSE